MRTGFFPVLPLMLLVCACQAAEGEVDTQIVDSTIGNAPAPVASTTADTEIRTPDHHARIIELVEAGDAALAAQDASGLLDVSQTLQMMGASPLGGAEDLGKRWAILAHDLTPDGDRKSIPFRGRIKGPAYRRHILGPGERDEIVDIFYAAEPAEMTLKSMNASALQWEILQDGTDGSPVCDGQIGTQSVSCRFLPLWTSKYRIRISNLSDQSTTYLFVTN